MTRKRVVVDHNPDGWPLLTYEQGYPGTQKCRSILRRAGRGLPPCDQPAVWRVRTAARGIETTGYYCDNDRPKETA